MQYNETTYIKILERMLDRARKDVDRSEGSFIWENFAATAREFELAYLTLMTVEQNMFVDTADRDHLIKHGATYGLSVNPATKARVKGEFIVRDNVEIPLGSRFTYDAIFYQVTKKIDATHYELECETPGDIGNRTFGQLLPAFNMRGFQSAKIVELIVPGEGEEETEAFRSRIKNHISGEAFGGNLLDYMEKLNKIGGVGDFKILRGPRGPGSVDVIITDSMGAPAAPELVNSVQEELNPLDVEGPPEIDMSGLGIVPIGHDTIVRSATGVTINIGFTLIYEDDYNFEAVKSDIEKSLKSYITELVESWGDMANYQEAISKKYKTRFLELQVNKIGGLLIDIAGIRDYEPGSITINGEGANLELEWDEIPVLGEVADG